MKQLAITSALALLLASTGVQAQDNTPSDNPELSEGAELLNRGFQLLLEGLANEIEPLAEEWSDGWADMVEKFGDMQTYHPPEVLPNGDIIIRRRTPLDPAGPGETDI
ncbi:AAA+ family ATPase [Aliiroseovarius halocynthiae]|uniref:AAA+ family ATPase n=2 Tax=Aliiroseovarius halocynthiae TaxID=985055 RepID=A0A545SME0_9RHOB|nr:AAA+ family ATPase [Aliiroseovarius halocynthiae]